MDQLESESMTTESFSNKLQDFLPPEIIFREDIIVMIKESMNTSRTVPSNRLHHFSEDSLSKSGDQRTAQNFDQEMTISFVLSSFHVEYLHFHS